MSDTKLTPDQIAEQYFKNMGKNQPNVSRNTAPNFSDLLATYGTAVYNTKDQRWLGLEEMHKTLTREALDIALNDAMSNGKWHYGGEYTRFNQMEMTDIWIDDCESLNTMVEEILEPETTHEWPEHTPLPSNLRSCKLRWED